MHARLSLALALLLLLLVATARAGLVFTSNTVGAYGACAANPLMNSSSVRSFVPTDVCVLSAPILGTAFTAISGTINSVRGVIFACGGGGLIQVRWSGDESINIANNCWETKIIRPARFESIFLSPFFLSRIRKAYMVENSVADHCYFCAL